jgi:hypothetical protein
MAIQIPLTYTKEALLEKLASLRPAAEKRDKAAIAKHKKEEAAYLKRFHAACREALKWDYETAKSSGFNARVTESNDYGGKNSVSAPRCPSEETNTLERLISLVNYSHQQRFMVTARGKFSEIYDLLTADIVAEKDVCE